MRYLFVGEYQQYGISELVFGQHAHELFARLADALTIVAVHDEDQTLDDDDSQDSHFV